MDPHHNSVQNAGVFASWAFGGWDATEPEFGANPNEPDLPSTKPPWQVISGGLPKSKEMGSAILSWMVRVQAVRPHGELIHKETVFLQKGSRNRLCTTIAQNSIGQPRFGFLLLHNAHVHNVHNVHFGGQVSPQNDPK